MNASLVIYLPFYTAREVKEKLAQAFFLYKYWAGDNNCAETLRQTFDQ
jgi:hypothetical protein